MTDEQIIATEELQELWEDLESEALNNFDRKHIYEKDMKTIASAINLLKEYRGDE